MKVGLQAIRVGRTTPFAKAHETAAKLAFRAHAAFQLEDDLETAR